MMNNMKSLTMELFAIIRKKTLSQVLSNAGYYRVWLCRKGKEGWETIHRLVAEAFIPNIKNKPQVNHKDGIKTNNLIDNLEWCTASENHLHAFKAGLRVGPKGQKNGKAVLNNKQVRVIAHLKNITKLSQRKVGKIFNIDQSTVSLIWNKKQWRSITNNI